MRPKIEIFHSLLPYSQILSALNIPVNPIFHGLSFDIKFIDHPIWINRITSLEKHFYAPCIMYALRLYFFLVDFLLSLYVWTSIYVSREAYYRRIAHLLHIILVISGFFRSLGVLFSLFFFLRCLSFFGRHSCWKGHTAV